MYKRQNSDSVEDQRIKLQVRDRLTSEFSHLLAQVQDADQAEAVLQDVYKRQVLPNIV